MRRLLIILGLLVLIAGAAVVTFYLSGAEIVVEIPERDISAALKGTFPIEQRKAGLLKTSLSHPRLELDGGSKRLTMDLEIAVDLGLASVGLGRSERGAATISSGLRYDRESGRLLLEGARLEELRVAELPDEQRGTVEEIINKALSRHVDGLVVYRMSSATYRESLARLFLKDVEIGDGVIRAVLGIGP